MSMAGCIRIRLPGLEVSANDKSPGRARRGTESQPSHSSRQASKELHPKVNMRQGHAGVRETDKRIAMEMCGKSHRKIGNTDLSSKATRQIGGDQPGQV